MCMNIFKPTTFTWWQLGLLKWAVLFIGIVIGSLWPTVFSKYALILLAVGFVIGVYLTIVWFRYR